MNYSKAKVFKIESVSTGLVYYGSTCDTLDDCLAELMNHHIAYRKGSMKYSTSFEVLWERDSVMTLVESCPCSNKQQLHAARDKYIHEYPCVNRPNRCKSGPNQLFPSYRIKYDKDPGDYENRLCELFGICKTPM